MMTGNQRRLPNVTSHDVAKLAGVSQSTVSRTFLASDLVTAETKERVMVAAEQLGYHPHALARSLITGKSRIIGVVVTSEYKEFYGNFLAELSQLLQPLNYNILSLLVPEHIDDAPPIIRTIREYRVDGLIIQHTDFSSEFAAECLKANTSVVLLGHHPQYQAVASVNSDNYGAGYQTTQLLIESGHRRISIIVGREDSWSSIERERGFNDALSARGYRVFSRAVGSYTAEGASVAARTLLDRPKQDRPDGLFVASDAMAIQVMEVARHNLGIQIPQELSIIGHDDIPAAALPSFFLTTYRHPLPMMLKRTVDVLLKQIDRGQNSKEPIVVKGEMIERGTVAVRNAGDGPDSPLER